MKRLRLRCYCCGEAIKRGEDFTLVSPSQDIDRVFVMLATGREE